MNLEEKNGKTRMTAAMIDPTTDDSDNIFYNELDASDMAADKYATAELFQRFGLKDDFRRLFNDNSGDPDFQIFMFSSLANKADEMNKGDYGELEKLAQAAIDNPKCSSLQKYCMRKSLWDVYLIRGEFEKALRCFEGEKNEDLSYIDRHAENLFYARYYLYKGEFSGLKNSRANVKAPWRPSCSLRAYCLTKKSRIRLLPSLPISSTLMIIPNISSTLAYTSRK